MKLIHPAPAPDAGAETSHVLHWVPGYVTSTGCGSWELQDAAAYADRAPGCACPVLGAPRDADAGCLALWAAGQLGCPVELEPACATAAVAGIAPFSVHIGREPLYYVRPAAAAASTAGVPA